MKKEKCLIGWGHRDVTPAGKVSLRGQFHVRVTEEVHDPLMTTALAIEGKESGEQAIIVSLDAVSVADELLIGCRDILSKKIPDFNVEKLTISATHTHATPEQVGAILGPSEVHDDVMTGVEYTDFLIEKISEAAIEAWNSRKEGAFSWGREYAAIGFNRRVSYFDGSSAMYGDVTTPEFSHIEGHECTVVEMLFTFDTHHKLTGMIVNVPCPSQCSEDAYFVSADFWHETREVIKKNHGEEIFILPQLSAAGDLSPFALINREADRRMMALKGYGDDYNFARRKDIAVKLSNVVQETLSVTKKDIRDKIEFGHKMVKLDLPERIATEADLQQARDEVAHWEAKLEEIIKREGGNLYSKDYSEAKKRIIFNKNVFAMHEKQQNGDITMPIELHILRIGDVAMCTNRFEYYLDFGERIKARSKALQTFVVQLAGPGTYLPTKRSMLGGSYGAYIASTPISPEGGQIIVEESLKNINKMFEE